MAYLARYNREQLVKQRYENYKNFYNDEISKNKFFIVENFGHLTHLQKINSIRNHGLIKRDKIWLFLPYKNNLMTENDKKRLAQIKPKKIELNEKILFDKDIFYSDSSIFGFGWTYDQITKGVWTDGNKSTIFLNLDKDDTQNSFLELLIEPTLLYLNQNLKLKISGEKINSQKFVFKDFDKKQIKIRVSLKDYDYNFEDLLKIDFVLSGTISPFEVKKSPDRRKLGVKLISLKLKNVD